MGNKINGNLKYILHSLCHIAVIESINKNFNNYEEFINNYYLLDSNILHLQQIGENVTNLTDEFKAKYDEIDFINIKGLRNVVVHNYDGLDYDDIYSIVKEDIPDLKSKYENIVINEFNLSNEFIEDYTNYFVNSRKFKDVL